jgi:hypothetical protein
MAQPGIELPPHVRVMQMMMGYWASQTLSAVAELGVADQIHKGVTASDELAHAVHAEPDALYRLLRTAAAVGLLTESTGKHFSLTPMGDCLRSDSPAGLRDFIVAEMAPGHWLPWGRLSEAVRTGAPQAVPALGMDLWSYYAKNAEAGACFARGMGNLAKMAAVEVTASYDFSPFSTVCDVGGSQGALIAAVLRSAPRSRSILLDRPDVIAAGKATVAAYGLGERLSAQGGDFFEAVPAADAYLLKQILHDWDEERSTAILETIGRVAKPGSKLFVIEMVVSDSPMGTPVKLMDLNMLVMLGGRERTAEQFGSLLGGAGWRLDKITPTQGLFAILEATRV